MDFFIVQSQYESLALEEQINMNPVQVDSLSEIDSIFHFPSYIKGKNNYAINCLKNKTYVYYQKSEHSKKTI